MKNCKPLEAPFVHWNAIIPCDSASSRYCGTGLQDVTGVCEQYQPTSGMDHPPSTGEILLWSLTDVGSDCGNTLTIIHTSRSWFPPILKKKKPRPFACFAKGGDLAALDAE